MLAVDRRHRILERVAEQQTIHIRELAAELGVPTARKPAAPCLAPRLPYGTRVTEEAPRRVDRAERAVKALGFRELRVRHLGRVGRLELAAADLARAERDDLIEALAAAVRAGGYEEALVSRAPLRSGSLNDGLRRRAASAPA